MILFTICGLALTCKDSKRLTLNNEILVSTKYCVNIPTFYYTFPHILFSFGLSYKIDEALHIQ